MIKLVVVDMDGTFLDDKKQKSPEYVKVIKELSKKGVQFCVASGRQMGSIKREFKGIEDYVIFIAENGSVVEFDNEIILHQPIDNKVRHEIIKKLKKDYSDKKLVYCTKDMSYIDDYDEESKKNAQTYFPVHTVVDNFEQVEDDPVKISIYSRNGYDEDCAEIEKIFSDRVKLCASGFEWMDIIRKDASKGNALKLIQKKLNVSTEETMAFGDQMNDIEMIENAKYSYAMENAVEAIKEKANFIAPSNNDFGVIQVLKKEFNIK